MPGVRSRPIMCSMANRSVQHTRSGAVASGRGVTSCRSMGYVYASRVAARSRPADAARGPG